MRCACVRSCVVFRLFCDDFVLVTRVRLFMWSECALEGVGNAIVELLYFHFQVYFSYFVCIQW